MSYCKAFSSNIGHHFTEDTIKMSALTGAAGVSIGGDTTCRQFGILKKKVSIEDIDTFSDTRLNIVDEISFAGVETLEKLSKRLQALTECRKHIYGNIHIAFIGDFCQLPGINTEPIYAGCPTIYWEQSLNQMVELKGHHRYKNDPALGFAMEEARNGNAEKLKEMLKSREIKENNLQIPGNFQANFATYTNKKRAEINANVFRTYLEQNHHENEHICVPGGLIVIRACASWHSSKKKLGFLAHHTLWECCLDGYVKDAQSQRADPFLCLFHGGELMVNNNIDVKNGIASGTCCRFEKAILMHGAQVQKIQVFGRWVNSVSIEHVEELVLRYDSMYAPQFVGTFKVRMRERKFFVEYPENGAKESKRRIFVAMAIKHFPVLVNYATTVHKLQGKSVDNLVIAEWCKKPNWAYVVLSRVRTLAGIFLYTPLPNDCSFAPNPEYLSMMERLRQNILANK